MWTSLSETIFQYSSSASWGAGSSVSLQNKQNLDAHFKFSKMFGLRINFARATAVSYKHDPYPT
jgi:hypothetical protein